jgi:cystathionine beta-synthase
MKYVNSMLEVVGNTPVLKLNKVAKDVPANVFVKLEYLNPSGSYKDRMALAMVEAAEKGLTWNNKKLKPGGVVVDASAGNTAPALAFVCAVKDYKAKLFIYKPMLRGPGVRLKIAGAYGPDINEARPPTDFLTEEEAKQFLKDDYGLTYIIAGKMQSYELEKNDPNVVWVDQIFNKYNYIGQMNIGYELYEQLDGKIDAFGCAVGSGATLLGTTLGLAEKNVNPLTFGVIPSGSEVYMELQKNESDKGEFKKSNVMKKLIEKMGLKKWQTEKSIIDEMLARGYPDKFFRVNEEEARNMANRLSREEGIYCGMSSGANVHVALKIAQRLKKNQNVVTVIVDRRDRYLGEYPNDVFIV